MTRPPILEAGTIPKPGQRYTLTETFVQKFEIVRDPFTVHENMNEATGQVELVEKRVSEGPMVIRGVFQREGVRNANGRVYGLGLWEKHLKPDARLMTRIRERQCYGQIEHPEKGSGSLEDAAILVTRLDRRMDESKDSATIIGEAEVLDTPKGRIVRDLIRCGVKVGVSSRATGAVDSRGNVDERMFDPETWDVVGNPSTPGAFPTVVEKPAIAESVRTEPKAPQHHVRVVRERSGALKWTVLDESDKIVNEYTAQAEAKNNGGPTMSAMQRFTALRQLCEASLAQPIVEASTAQIIALDNALTQHSVDFNGIVNEDSTLKDAVRDMQDRIRLKRKEISERDNRVEESDEDTDADAIDESDESGEEVENKGTNESDEEKSVEVALKEALALLEEAEAFITRQELTIKSERKISDGLTERLANAEKEIASLTETVAAKDSIISSLTERVDTTISDTVEEAIAANPDLEGVRSLMERCNTIGEINQIVESAKKNDGVPKIKIEEAGLPSGKNLDSSKDQNVDESEESTDDESGSLNENSVHPVAAASMRTVGVGRARAGNTVGASK